MDKTFNLFVYGTLTDSNPAGRLLKGFKHEKASAKGKIYALKPGYPGAVFSEDSNGTVHGQLVTGIPYEGTSENGVKFNVADELDHYEGCDQSKPLYTRKKVFVTVKDEISGEDALVEANVYEMNDVLKGVILSRIESGDWNAFITKPCGNLDEIEKDDNGQKYVIHLCKLTGRACPYVPWDESDVRKTGLCTLPEYAESRPEESIPDVTLSAINGAFSGCMQCGVLSKHYYLRDCCLGFSCFRVNDQLKLWYLSKRYTDMKNKEGK